MSSSRTPSNQAPVRPFAPDDFRRERKSTPAPPSSLLRNASLRPPPVPQSSQHYTSLDGNEGYVSGTLSTPRRSSLFESQSRDSTPYTAAPHEQTLQSTSQASLRDLRAEAEREWESLRERRRSLGLLPSHLQASLAKSAIMTKSDSSQSLFQQSIEVQRTMSRRDRSAQMGRSPSRPSAAASPSGYATLASSRPSSRDQEYYNSQPTSDTLLPYGLKNSTTANLQSQPSRISTDILFRANSKVSKASSHMSSGDESTKELLQDIDDDESMPLVSEDHSDSSSTTNIRVPLRSLLLNNQPATVMRRLETSNNLTGEEKMEQLKRSQKLDTMLGGEWRRQIDEDWNKAAELSSNSSNSSIGPFKGVKRIGLLRRQSDPLHLHHTIQAGALEQHIPGEARKVPGENEFQPSSKGASTTRWKSLHLKRSRSSFNLRQDIISSKSLALSHLAHTIPPLDIHPKAATLLGLCVLPQQLLNKQALYSDLQQGDKDHLHNRSDSYSSVEILRDSDSIMERGGLKGIQVKQSELDDNRHFASHLETNDLEGEDTAKSAHRSERRRRVKKISKWLGAVVPPHLILPNPEGGPFQQRSSSASGYNLDEAPPSPFADYMSGIPITRGNIDGAVVTAASTGPLVKARSVVHAKLAKKTNNSAPPIHSDTTTLADLGRIGLSEQDRANNVKRNHKLTSVFGQAPPQDLLLGRRSSAIVTSPQKAEWPGSRGEKARAGSVSPKKRDRHLRSVSPSAVNRTSFFESSDNEAASSDSARDPTISQQRYRASIKSLEYLLEKDPPLLNKLVAAFEREESKSGRGYKERVESSSVGAQDEDVTFTDSLDSNEADFPSMTLTDDKSRARDVKIRRHQKLGRWFGEPLPSTGKQSQQASDENIRQDAEASATVYTNLPTLAAKGSSTRMAPRSAGSALRPHSLHNRRALTTILNSIEGEVTDDDGLSEQEKQQLQQRLKRLQSIDPIEADISYNC